MVQGFRLPLLQTPVQSKPPPEIHLAADQTGLVTTEVEELICKGKISPALNSGSRRFSLSTFPGPQEGQKASPGNKSESSERVHPGGAFQDGELSYDKGSGETPGMASKGGPQGCVLSGPSSPRPPVPVARSDIPVLLPAIRPVLCSESVHKADETSGGIPEGERNETNHLFGRHTGDQQLPGGSKGMCPFNQGSLQFPGLNHQRKEITTGALTGGSIFGVSHFNSDYEHLSAFRGNFSKK